jgi:hypothetical protein
MTSAANRIPVAPTTDSVPSPCTNVCTMDDASGYCVGCYRTLDEITAWSGLDAPAKRAVLAALPARREWRSGSA